MSVAKVAEISATSSRSFEDAISQGIARACKNLRNVRSAWIKEQRVRIEDGKPSEYQVNMKVTFILEAISLQIDDGLHAQRGKIGVVASVGLGTAIVSVVDAAEVVDADGWNGRRRGGWARWGFFRGQCYSRRDAEQDGERTREQDVSDHNHFRPLR